MPAMHLDTIGLGIVVVMLVALMFAVLMLQRQRSQKTISIWFGSVVVGLLLGSALTLGLLRLGVLRQFQAGAAGFPIATFVEVSDTPSPDDGGGMGSGGMGGGGMGSGGMGGGGMGGPNPKRDLTTLVRKLDLLTGDIKITLTAEQSDAVTTALADIEETEEMSDEDAEAKYDVLLAQLDDDQRSRLDAIGLPRPQRGSGGPGGGSDGAMAAADNNPFQQEANAEALTRLRQRIAP
jgi:hypothetical protein